jgi:hypothetical protein
MSRSTLLEQHYRDRVCAGRADNGWLRGKHIKNNSHQRHGAGPSPAATVDCLQLTACCHAGEIGCEVREYKEQQQRENQRD